MMPAATTLDRIGGQAARQTRQRCGCANMRCRTNTVPPVFDAFLWLAIGAGFAVVQGGQAR
eukprot:156595-Chlamydomonas_euryale.AAC.4